MSENEQRESPPPCNREVYARGAPIFVTHTIRSWQIEAWVQKIAARSGQPVDWHFAGGRAVVLALGDIQAARDALVALRKEHDDMWIAKAMEGPYGMSREAAETCCASIWDYAAAEAGPTATDERLKYTISLR